MITRHFIVILLLPILLIPLPFHSQTPIIYPNYPLEQYRLDSFTSEGTSLSSDFDINGSVVFLAEGYDGIRILDISDKTNPVELSSYFTGGFVRRVKLSGDILYVSHDHGIFTGAQPNFYYHGNRD